jgi:hypothetical protein
VIDKKPKAKITIEVSKEVTRSIKKSAEPVKSTRESKAKQSPRKPTKSVEQTHDRKTKKKEQETPKKAKVEPKKEQRRRQPANRNEDYDSVSESSQS